MKTPRGVIDEINAKTTKAPVVYRKLVDAVSPSLLEPLLIRGSWRCHSCQKQATEFTLNFLAYLHLQPPYIEDIMTRPVCGNPECHVRTETWCQNVYKEAVAMQEKPRRKEMRKGNINEYACAKCTKKEDKPNGIKLKVCGRCKHVYYCSQDCQAADWKKHKPFCIPINDA